MTSIFSTAVGAATRPSDPSALLVLAQVPPAEGPGIVDFFLLSGPMAKVVLAILVFFSVVSWAILVSKVLQYRRADQHSARFLDTFRRSKRFSEVNAAAGKLFGSPLVGVFQAGHAEIDAQIKSGRGVSDPEGSAAGGYRIRSLSSVERTLQRAASTELSELARSASFLATTAAATPFIGLFGTVWGIMVSFQEISASGSTSLDTIAPGIAEALINTAAGLAAAIPALIGYNYLNNRLRRLRAGVQDFISEFLNLTERNFQ
jgi:biopolymer transport protein TolQ